MISNDSYQYSKKLKENYKNVDIRYCNLVDIHSFIECIFMLYGRYLKNNPNSTIPFIKNNIKEYYNIYRINDMENIPNLMYKYMDNLLTSTFDILGSEYIQKDIDIEV